MARPRDGAASLSGGVSGWGSAMRPTPGGEPEPDLDFPWGEYGLAWRPISPCALLSPLDRFCFTR